ncbi:MAG: hypothetical protein HN368_21745 [Spirochaetales bacterium]|jgi:hypothetical protein|nr:hypothetical protein [Spirochaetales bacterium]
MSGWYLSTLCIYAEKDPDGPWAEAANRLVDGLRKVTIVDGDYAYLFLNCTEPGKDVVKPAEPPRGFRAAINGWVAYGLVQAYRSFGRTDALELAHKIMRFVMLESEYFDEDGRFCEDIPGITHFHAHTRQIDSALMVLNFVDDQELLERTEKAYAFARGKGDAVTGFFPEWLGRPKDNPCSSEICEVADMICAALKLCRLGRDKWDDVDRWTRNQFAECQLVSTGWLTDGRLQPMDRQKVPLFEAGCEHPTHGTTDRVAERLVGAFSGWPAANDWVHGHGWSIMHCCTGNGTRTVYQVWKDIVTWEDGQLRVNLLMNRASPWADINSHIPFTGRVDVRIKQDLLLEIRMPEWCEPEQACCQVNGEHRPLTFDVRYAQVGQVQADDEVVFEFPITERTEQLEIENQNYTVTLRGNDVVYIDPAGKTCPLYQKGHFRLGETSWKKTNRWVPDKEISWM